MSEKIGDVPESEQNRENEKFFFLSFLYKEEREKKFFSKTKNPERYNLTVPDFFISHGIADIT
jgi:hypothetical protein